MRCVVLDVGETLVDESRAWAAWADWLGVPRRALTVALEDVIARGGHHREAFAAVRPGIDLDAERRARRAAGVVEEFEAGDLYPDALGCLEALRSGGYAVGIAGNTGVDVEAFLWRTFPGADMIASSAGLGAEKPAPAFFDAVAAALAVPSGEIAYVGDRLDNDVLPARAAGMLAVHIRRGPWGRVHAQRPDAALADLRIDSLAELPDALDAIGG